MTPFPKILLAAAAALVSVTVVHAADVKYLADRHVARGVTCEMCHTKDMKVKPSTKYEDLDVCTDCHGDYAAMIKKTAGKYETNPHGQHEGALPCTECHKGHKPGVNYCGGCHNFEFKVP